MVLRRYILALLFIFSSLGAFAQGIKAQARVLILLDRSSSMVQSWAGGKEKYKAADEMILKLVDSLYAINPDVEIALRVFGHQFPAEQNNCYDTRTEILFSKDVRTQMALRLADIRPLGVTPIAYALQQAATYDISDLSKNAYCIVLVTDGGESCGGNLCDVMDKFLKGKIHFKPYIVSLEDNPALRNTYSCMGEYLQALSHADIMAHVGTIVEAFRPALRISNDELKQMNITGTIPSAMKGGGQTVKIETKTADKEPVKEKIIFTKPPPNEKIPGLVNDRLKLFPVTIQPPVLKMLPVGPVEVVPDMTKTPIAKLQAARQVPFNVIFVIEEKQLTPRPVPPYTINPQLPVAVTPPPPPPKPEKKADKEPKHLDYKVVTEDAPETSVEVYFTDGKGKFYSSTPQVQLLDPGTNQAVKKFYRTVDENGNPDPQLHILPGRYDIAFTETRGVVDKNVEIVAGRKNKIYITMKTTSLSFAYRDAAKRPISEFSAVVTERNKTQGGRVQLQKCTELLEYEPGNYHVVINTFPEDVRNVDLDFNETEIEIAQPGFAKFSSADGKAHDITLWRRLGDKFERFYSMDLRDPKNQHLQIQPGEYQVHYMLGPGRGQEKVMPFLIKATQESAIVIK